MKPRDEPDPQKGARAENLVACAFAHLKLNGEIRNFIHAEAGRQLDSQGIDFLVQINNGLWFGLQCKTNIHDICKHLHKHPDIQYVVVIGAYSRKKIIHWRTSQHTDQVLKNVMRQELQLCIRIFNTSSDLRPDSSNYQKIVEQMVKVMRKFIAVAPAAR